MGLARLRQAGLTLARLRARPRWICPTSSPSSSRSFCSTSRSPRTSARPLGSANLDAFFDALNGYLAVDEIAGLGGFLGWLREAERRDGLCAAPGRPRAGHRAGAHDPRLQGPGVGHRGGPATGRAGDAGDRPGGLQRLARVRRAALRVPRRRAELPEFGWRQAGSRKELLEFETAFTQEVKERHELEERRLAYVAVTRARHSLLLSGSFWATQAAARGPSPFLIPLAADGILGELPTVSEFTREPARRLGGHDRLAAGSAGRRRDALERAAELVRDAQRARTDAADAAAHGCGAVAETSSTCCWPNGSAPRCGTRPHCPPRVPASRFKDYVTDPEAVAASLRGPCRRSRTGRPGWARCSTAGFKSGMASAGRAR